MLKALARIKDSKKVLLVMVPVVVNLLGAAGGADLESQLFLVIDGGFALLAIIQGVIDAKNGSPSDKAHE